MGKRVGGTTASDFPSLPFLGGRHRRRSRHGPPRLRHTLRVVAAAGVPERRLGYPGADGKRPCAVPIRFFRAATRERGRYGREDRREG